MFFQEPPPDTSGYMIAGYVVFFVVMAIYLVSLFLRWRNLDRDLTLLESMKQESEPTAVEPAAARPKVPISKRKTAAASSGKKKRK